MRFGPDKKNYWQDKHDTDSHAFATYTHKCVYVCVYGKVQELLNRTQLE